MFLEMGLAFSITFLISLGFIRYAPVIKVSIKPELESIQSGKRGTPSIGGLAFCLGTFFATVLFPHRFSPTVYFPLLGLLLFASIGMIDDIAKARKGNGDGITSVAKLILQAIVASVLLFFIHRSNSLTTDLILPFFKGRPLSLGWGYYLFALLYIMYFVNSVNITDCLDALAAGSSLPLLLLIALFSFKANSPFSPALIASLLAFLLFNKKPARYFMGDCGSHALGGYIAVSALMLNVEVVLLVASGLFLLEFASSLIQIIAIRSTGKKVFSIAPLHHAYELKGVAERTIVGRFTLASWFFALLGLLLFLGTGG